eukprot:gene23738-23787_t
MIELSPRGPDADNLRVREFYLGRQPILDRNQALFAYELLFRNAPVGPARVSNALTATAAVIAHASQLGMERTVGDALGFVNVDAEVLMTDIFSFLPRERLVLEVSEQTPVTPVLISRMAELHAQGFRFALDEVQGTAPSLHRLLPLVDYVKLDVQQVDLSSLMKLAPRFRESRKTLIAEKVETREEFKNCLDLGFDYFQ